MTPSPEGAEPEGMDISPEGEEEVPQEHDLECAVDEGTSDDDALGAVDYF